MPADTVAGFDLAGKPVNIPLDRLDEAKSAGYKLADQGPPDTGPLAPHEEVPMHGAVTKGGEPVPGFDLAGKPVSIPPDRLDEALKAGYKVDTEKQYNQEHPVWSVANAAAEGVNQATGGLVGMAGKALSGRTPEEEKSYQKSAKEAGEEHPVVKYGTEAAAIGSSAVGLGGLAAGPAVAAESGLARVGLPAVGKYVAQGITGLAGVSPTVVGEAAQGNYARAGEIAGAAFALPAILGLSGKAASGLASGAYDLAEPLIPKVSAALNNKLVKGAAWMIAPRAYGVISKLSRAAKFAGQISEAFAPEAEGEAAPIAEKSFQEAQAFMNTPEGKSRLTDLLKSDATGTMDMLAKSQVPPGLFPTLEQDAPASNVGTQVLSHFQLGWAKVLADVPSAIAGKASGAVLSPEDVTDADAVQATNQAVKLSADPASILQHASDLTGDLNHDQASGQVTNHIFNTVNSGVAYLASIAPQPPSYQPFQDNKWKPDPSQLSTLRDAVSVIKDPVSIVKHFNNGTLTSAMLAAGDAVYPQLMQSIRMVIQEIGSSPKAPQLDTKRLSQVNLLMGQDPSLISDSQTDFQTAPEEGSQGSPQAAGKNGGKAKVSTKPRFDKLPSTLTGAQASQFGSTEG